MRSIHNEKGVKLVVKKYLAEHNWFWWMPAANGFGRAGVSDFNAVRDGKFLAIETKFKDNKPTPLQISYLTNIISFGGIAFLVTETNLDYLKVWLEAYEAHDVRIMANTSLELLRGVLRDEDQDFKIRKRL